MTMLFCIPHAGGAAEVSYSSWRAYLRDDVRVVPLEPPGHGRRMSEPFADSIEATANDLLSIITKNLQNGERYAIYAHSMGTLIAYELIRVARENGLPEPVGLFLSGRLPPDHKYDGPDLHELSDHALIESLKKIDGSPLELFEEPDLVKLFLPIIRNDYRSTETYKFEEPHHVIKGFIHCFYSDNDRLVNLQGMEKWRKYGEGPFKIHHFSGHHFFINEHYVTICNTIKDVLSECEMAE